MLQNKGKQRKTQKRASAGKLGVPRADFGHSGVALGSFSGALGWFGDALGRSWHALGTLLGRLGRLLGASWTSWTHLGHNLEKSQGLGSPYWTSFGEVLGHFFAFFRIFFAFVAHLKSSWLILSIFFVFCSIFLDFAWISGGFWEGSGKNFR